MNWIAEIDELHALFQRYFLGEESSLDRVERALATGFTMVGPDAVESDRSTVLEMLRGGHGHASALRIRTTDHRLKLQTDDVVVATYIEHHELSSNPNQRLTTVVFSKSTQAPNGVLWEHAQETFIR